MTQKPTDPEWWVLSKHVDEGDWRGSILTNAFVDAMLLAFIRAHPLMEQDEAVKEADRLRDAREALFGIPAGTRNKYYSDYAALADMARGYLDDRGGTLEFLLEDKEGQYVCEPDEANCRPLNRLAGIALDKGLSNGGRPESATRQSSERRLAKKFVRDFDEIMRFAHDGSGVRMMAEKIRELQILLGPTSVPMSLPADFIRDLKATI